MSRPETKDATRHVFRGDFVPGFARASPRCGLAAISKQELTGPALLIT